MDIELAKVETLAKMNGELDAIDGMIEYLYSRRAMLAEQLKIIRES